MDEVVKEKELKEMEEAAKRLKKAMQGVGS